MSEIIVNSKNIGNRNLTVWLEDTGAEGEIRTPEVVHHRFSRPAP